MLVPMHKPDQILLLLFMCVLMSIGACSKHDADTAQARELPVIPEIDTSGFLPVIRAQLDTAVADLDALPYDPQRNGQLGMMLAAYEQDGPAAVLFERAWRLDSSAFAWPYYLGFTRYDLSDLPGAIAAMRAAIAINPAHANARIKLGEYLLEAGDYKESREVFRRVVSDMPERVEGHLGLGKLSNLEDEPEEAVEQLQAALKIESRIGEIHFALAEAYRKLGDTDSAAKELALFERYRNIRPSLRDEELLAIGAMNVGDLPYLSRGMAYMNSGRVVEAAQAYQKAVEINPKNIAALTGLMELHGRNRELAAAGRYYHQALDVNAANADLQGKWAAILRMNGQRSEAIEAYRRAVELDPFNANFKAGLGRALQDTGDLQGAERAYRQALEADADNRDAGFNLAYLLAMRQENAEAARLLRPLVNNEPRPAPTILQLLARVEAQLGAFDDALSLLARAESQLADGSNPVLLQRVQTDKRAVEAGKAQAQR